MSLALFPGSFDPFHLGHLAIVEWAAGAYDDVIVAVASNPEKAASLLTPDDRVRLATLATQQLGNVSCLAVQSVTGVLAREHGADVIIRSAHKEADLERSLAVLNKFMSGGIPTEFAPSNPETEGISSTLVRELLLAGDTEAALALVPPAIREELRSAAQIAGRGSRPSTPAGPGPMTLGRRVQPARVAVVQDAPVLADRDATLDKVLTLTQEAAAGGAQAVVFPEAFLPGYPDWVWRTSPSDERAAAYYAALFDNAIVIGSAVTQVLAVAARRFGIYLSVGIDEREPAGSTLYDTQLFFGPDGSLLSAHRKLAPVGAERLVWGDGRGSDLEVVETPYGRMGTLIGSESYLPMARATLYAQGLDIYLAPAAETSDLWLSTTRHIAKEGSVFLVGAHPYLPSSELPDGLPARSTGHRSGEVRWNGGSLVVDPSGRVIAGPLRDQAGLVIEEIDANTARHQRHLIDPIATLRNPNLAPPPGFRNAGDDTGALPGQQPLYQQTSGQEPAANDTGD